MSRTTQSLIAEYERHFDTSPSSLGRFLSQHGPLNRPQIQSLILWQQSQSWRNGQGTRTEEFISRYPEQFCDREWVLDLIYAEYLLSRQHDPTVSIAQFSQRFPDYADLLREQVEFHDGFGAELIDDWLAGDADESKVESLDSVASESVRGFEERADLLPSFDRDGLSPVKRLPQITIPGYRILSELGRGGLAVVYLAQDERLHRRVALKMLLAGQLASETLLRRIEVEGEAIARLQHPHIVQIFEVGLHDNHPYLALEYANSGTLAQWMRRQPQSPRSAATIIQQLARTIQFAHDKGILHRDLKPSNVMLHSLSPNKLNDDSSCSDQVSQPDDISHLQLKIADFGLAKFINGDSHDRGFPVGATMTGDLLGTAAYMSPEQARGASNQLSAATDVYSLGAVLYELLTGRPPFVGIDPLAILNQVMLDEPVRPTEFVPHIPRDLETICLKCLHKNADRRYTTAKELADEIERYFSNQPIQARRTSVVERTWRWCRRHPAQASSLGFLITLIGLILGGLVSYSEIMRERVERISTANGREHALRQEAQERLLDSRLSRASALLTSQQVGQRFDSLEALDEAHRMSASIALSDAQRQRIRNGVLAALTLPDIQYHANWTAQSIAFAQAFDIDSERRCIALPTTSSQVSIVDYSSGATLMTIDPQMPIHSLTMNQDATLLAIGGSKLCVYDLSVQPPVRKLEFESMICVFSEVNSRELITVSADAVVTQQNVDTLASVELFRSAGKPRQVTMSPDGNVIAIWTDTSVEIFDLFRGEVRLRLPPPMTVEDQALVWNPSSTTLAVGPYPQGIELWDIRDRVKLLTVPQSESATKFCFDTIGSRLLAYSQWGSFVKLWNLTTGQCEFTQKNMRLQFAEASPTGFNLWQTHGNSQLTLASIVSPLLFKDLPSVSRASGVSSNVFVAYNSDGTLIALVKEGTLELFDALSLRLLGKVVIGSSYFQFGPSDDFITLSSNGMFRWPKKEAMTATGKTLDFGPPQKMFSASPFAPFEISRDGNWLGLSDSEDVHLWSMVDRRTHVSLPHADTRRLAFSADNKLCASGGWNTGNVNIWSIATGEKVKQIEEATPCIVKFSNDGQWLAIGSKDVSIWNTRDWKLAWRCEVIGQVSSGMSLCFSPDSQQLAVSDALGGIHLLEVLGSGQQYAEIAGPMQDQILEMTFAPNGKQLAILTSRGASVWDLDALRGELVSRKLDWDHRIQKVFSWPTVDAPSGVSVSSVSFILNEAVRQREASEQATRAEAAILRFDYQSAQAAIDRAIELKLKAPTACNDLAWRLVTGPMVLRDPDRALELIRRAIDSPKVSADKLALYQNTLGVVQYRAGLLDEAFNTLTQSVSTQSPEDQPYDLFFLSMCAARQGDSVAAKEFFDKAESLRTKFRSSSNLQWNTELEEFSREARGLLK